MSYEYEPKSDYRNWWSLGGIVEFAGPYGERLRGEIVRVSSGSYIHVEVGGRIYHADFGTDNISQVGGW